MPGGIITALVTPFERANEEVDFLTLKKIIDFQCAAGVDGIFVSGSTGEAYAMGPEEKRELLAAAVEYTNGRAAVFFGAGGTSTKQTIKLIEMAEAEKADDVSVINTYFATPSQQELISYYTDIAASTSLPVVMYNHPLRTRTNISADTVRVLSGIENIVGIKDSSANVNNSLDYIVNARPGVNVLSGNDSLIVTLMDLGAAGAVCASANFVPELVVGIYKAYKNGEKQKAVKLQKQLFEVRKLFPLGTYPAMIKAACALTCMDMGPCRKPLAELGEKDKEKIKKTLKGIGRL